MDGDKHNSPSDVAAISMAHDRGNDWVSSNSSPIRLQVDPSEIIDTIVTFGQEKELKERTQQAVDQYNEPPEDMSENTLLMPTVRPRSNLGHDLSTSQRWRLSMNGSPEVFGSICDVCPQVEEQQQDQPTTKVDADRRDSTFRVPLLQTVQLASAMFDNGHRIPLVLYYAAEELRNRATNGSLDLQTLFPEDWDKAYDESFEALVTVFDERPFGQGYNLTLAPPDSHLGEKISHGSLGSSKMENLVQSLDMEARSTHSSCDLSSSASSSTMESPLYSPATTPSPEPRSSDASTHQSENQECTDERQSSASASEFVSSSNLSRLILRFLRDLPDALIPQDVFVAMVATVQLQGHDAVKSQTLAMLLQNVSGERQHLLQFLLELVDDLVKTVALFGHNNSKNDDARGQEPATEELPKRTADDMACIDRVSRVLGLVCSSYFPRQKTETAQERLLLENNKSSLLGHYRNCIEQQTRRAQLAATISNTTMVFQYLVQLRVQLFPTSPPELVDQLNSGAREGQQGELGLHNGYQSDTALVEHRRAALPRKRDEHWRMRGRLRKIQNKPSLVNTSTERGNPQQRSTETLCDSAVEIRGHDLLALAILQEQTARMKGHAPHPSVATMHSIMAEGSVQGDHVTGVRVGQCSLNIVSAQAGATLTVMTGEDLEGLLDEDEFDKAKKRRQMGFMDFLQEPLDRVHEEREIQLVEQDIIRSEITSKFLANNLVGLYPTSSPTSIPAIILPSARQLLQPASCSPREVIYNGLLEFPSQKNMQLSPRFRPRELMLSPKEQIILPEDHVMSDSCTCSYCATSIQPSKIPVLSKEEHELAELKSQCQGKDQHVTELLKTVQSLQGQVNILNAKLLFLHDHHTTRPMRRRTLVPNNYPTLQSAPVSATLDEPSVNTFAQQITDSNQFRHNEPRSAGPAFTASSITTASNGSSPPNSRRSPLAFSDGIRLSSDIDDHLPSDFRHPTVDQEGNPDLRMLDDDETMSFLDLNDGRPPPPSIKHSQIQHWSGRGLITQSGFARGNAGAYFGAGGSGGPPSARVPRYETELERALRDVEEAEEEPDREGEDLLDEFYYKDAYKTMDQQLYRRPVLPMPPPPRPMSSDQYKKHHRMSLPIQNLMSKRISLRDTFRWRGRATAVAAE